MTLYAIVIFNKKGDVVLMKESYQLQSFHILAERWWIKNSMKTRAISLVNMTNSLEQRSENYVYTTLFKRCEYKCLVKVRSDGLSCVVITNRGYPTQNCMVIITEVHQQFLTDFPDHQSWPTERSDHSYLYLDECTRTYQDPSKVSLPRDTHTVVGLTKTSLQETRKQVHQRGTKLNYLKTNIQSLKETSDHYQLLLKDSHEDVTEQQHGQVVEDAEAGSRTQEDAIEELIQKVEKTKNIAERNVEKIAKRDETDVEQLLSRTSNLQQLDDGTFKRKVPPQPTLYDKFISWFNPGRSYRSFRDSEVDSEVDSHQNAIPLVSMEKKKKSSLSEAIPLVSMEEKKKSSLTEDLLRLLQQFDVDEHVCTFEEEKVYNIDTFKELTDEDFKAMGINLRGDIVNLRKAVRQAQKQ